MDEFDVKAWERKQAHGMRNIYLRDQMAAYSPPRPEPSAWTANGVLVSLLLLSIGGFLIWGTWDDIAEHFKPAQPVAVKQEAAPDIITTIRGLEQVLADAKQLNAELHVLHQQLTQLNAKLAAK